MHSFPYRRCLWLEFESLSVSKAITVSSDIKSRSTYKKLQDVHYVGYSNNFIYVAGYFYVFICDVLFTWDILIIWEDSVCRRYFILMPFIYDIYSKYLFKLFIQDVYVSRLFKYCLLKILLKLSIHLKYNLRYSYSWYYTHPSLTTDPEPRRCCHVLVAPSGERLLPDLP